MDYIENDQSKNYRKHDYYPNYRVVFLVTIIR